MDGKVLSVCGLITAHSPPQKEKRKMIPAHLKPSKRHFKRTT